MRFLQAYPLYAGIVAAIAALGDHSTTTSAQESPSVPVEAATLELHKVRASNLQAVADLVVSIVSAERVVLIPAHGQLAVFAAPSVQDAVARKIADHEKNALLVEVVDFSPCEPEKVWNRVEQALRRRQADPETELSMRPHCKCDASRRRLLVCGSESDIELARSVVESLVRAEVADQQTRPLSGTEHRENAESKSRALADSGPHQELRAGPPADAVDTSMLQPPGLSLTEEKFLPAPRGPVKIVHVKGLDLLLIRGRVGVPRESEGKRPAQD